MSKGSLILGEAIRKHRRKLSLTMKQLAELADIDLRTVTNIESGNGNPTFDTLLKLIRVLNIDAGEVFYPDQYRRSQNRSQLHSLVRACSETEAERLLPVIQVILKALRSSR